VHDAGHAIGGGRLETLAAVPAKPQGAHPGHVRDAEQEVQLLQRPDGAPLSPGGEALGPT
jgi:hypothetical protein